ncbi:hypothetical protein AAMO2058_001240400 [Amorphochlora amoebiformis]
MLPRSTTLIFTTQVSTTTSQEKSLKLNRRAEKVDVGISFLIYDIRQSIGTNQALESQKVTDGSDVHVILGETSQLSQLSLNFTLKMFSSHLFRCSNTSIALPASAKKLSKNAVKTSPVRDSKISTSIKPKYVKGIQSKLTRVFVSGLPKAGKTSFTAAANALAPRNIQFFDEPAQAFQARVDIVIVMVDAKSVDSIRLASVAKRQLQGFLQDRPGFLLVGNKVDTIKDNHHGVRTGAALFTTSKHAGFAKWFVASAKDNTKVEDIVKYVHNCHITKRRLIAQGILTPTPPSTPEKREAFALSSRLKRACKAPWTPSPPKKTKSSRRKISKPRCDYHGALPVTPPTRDQASFTVKMRLARQFEELGEA